MIFRHLRYFVSVAELKSFTAAAYALNITQPSISQQIADLEKTLGFSLFKRSSRSVKLTVAGEVFLKEAKEILRLTENAIEKATKAFKGYSGELRIGALEPAVVGFLPRVIRTFKKKHPDVVVTIQHMNPEVQLKAFQEEKIDIGFTRFFAQENSLNLQQDLIYEDSIVAVLPKDHPLSNQKAISITELAGESFILFNRVETKCFFDVIVRFCQEEGKFDPSITHEPNLLQTLFLLIESGLGVSLVPACVRHLNIPNIQFVDLKEETPIIPLMISYQNEPSPVTKAFLKTFREIHPSMTKKNM
ncbi:MAG: LysR family transcriptional regulator [Alphaproteobacteria bacterium]|nr:LysR family transcriptional regulator [Alphaproteobacteria bacterium]